MGIYYIGISFMPNRHFAYIGINVYIGMNAHIGKNAHIRINAIGIYAHMAFMPVWAFMPWYMGISAFYAFIEKMPIIGINDMPI